VRRTAEHSGLGIRQVPRHLQHPRLIRVRCYAGNDDAACGEIDHEEDVVCDQASPAPYLDGKKVAGRDRFPVRLEEHRPGDTMAMIRGRLNQMILQNTANRAASDFDVEIE
jgi:hypothetical protein